MLRTDRLGADFPGRCLVEDLTVGFSAGEVWGVLGRNGSGKSTLLGMLAGVRAPSRGKVLLEGTPLDAVPRRELATRIGILFQEEAAQFWGSAREYVLLGRHPHARGLFAWGPGDQSIADAELARQNLDGLAGRAFASLSGGERQRVRAAALFAQRPRVYLLDEPLQHLDLPHQVRLMEALVAHARAGAAVIIVMHDLVLAGRYCSHFLLLHGDGRFVAGPRAEVFDAQRLGELYGYPLDATEMGGERVLLPRSGAGGHV